MNKGFYECPYCGANLDPGEKCDCQERHEESEKPTITYEEKEETKERRCA